MVEQILPGIYRIPVPLVGNPLRELNSYLIRGDGRCLLIDTGFRQEPCRDALQAALDELGVRKEETDVLVTHLHADHSGLSDVFVGPEKQIYISDIDRRYLQSGDEREQIRVRQDQRYREEGFPEREAQALAWKNPARNSIAPPGGSNYVGLKEGDVLEIGGYRLRAILTPGHTPGHMCFWMEEQGAMFLGDHVLFDISPNITFWSTMPDALGTYMDSLRRISAYDVQLPLPAHRGIGDFKSRVAALLQHHERRLEQVRQIVREHPGLTGYEIAGRMTWKIRCNSWDDFPVTQKWFAVGECIAHLDRLRLQGELRAEPQNGLQRYYIHP